MLLIRVLHDNYYFFLDDIRKIRVSMSGRTFRQIYILCEGKHVYVCR